MAGALERERAFHERLYSGSAQRRFRQAAVREFREHRCAHMLRRTGLGREARVLSVGCGIGDTEIAMAPRVARITGVDLAAAGIAEARAAALRAGVSNAVFLEGALDSVEFEPGSFDLVMAIFFLHHLPDPALDRFPRAVARLLAPGGWFYSLDPSRLRLSGAVGRILIPGIMKQHQSPDERELDAAAVAKLFSSQDSACQAGYYDFLSTPLAGLFPALRGAYRAARRIDDLLVRIPLLRRVSSNFEILARRPADCT